MTALVPLSPEQELSPPATVADDPAMFMAGPEVTAADIDIVVDALRHGWYEHAYDYVETFEQEFAAYHQRRFALMTPNCTSAIHLLLAGLGIGPGDEVIVPECTWIASMAPITYTGATPVFCDIDPATWCLNADTARRAISERTKAILAVDLYGNMPDMHALQQVADDYAIPLLEDAAEAVGSVLHGVRAGKFGTASVFSFHRTKTITTGEGGMLLIDDEGLFERCRFLRDHGRVSGQTYRIAEIAFKYMPFNIQAALGHAQFLRIEELVSKKRSILSQYRARLGCVPGLHLNPEPERGRNGAWCSTLVFAPDLGLRAEQAMEFLRRRGYPTRPFFYPLSSLAACAHLRPLDVQDKHPTAYDVSSRGINLPSALNTTEAQIEGLCAAIALLLREGPKEAVPKAGPRGVRG